MPEQDIYDRMTIVRQYGEQAIASLKGIVRNGSGILCGSEMGEIEAAMVKICRALEGNDETKVSLS